MRNAGPRLLAALALLLAGCPPKRVAVNGQEMTEVQAESSATADLEKLRADAASQPPQVAAEAFEALARRYFDVPAGGEALYEAAVRWRAAKRPEKAAADLGDLLTRFPLTPRAREAKLQLGLAEVEAGRPRDGLSTLASLWDKLPEEDRLETARAAAGAAEAAHLWPDAVRWHSEVARLAPPPERAGEVARATEIIDGRLSFLEVARLREQLQPDSPALPAALMKLARVYVHLREYGEAEQVAREELSRFPDGPYAADARALLDRLARRAQVNPAVIGLAIPRSGKFEKWGDLVLEGVGLAVGPETKIAVRDTRGEPDGAAQAVEELALQEGAVAIIGGATNAEAQRAALTAQELEVPFLSLSKLEGVTDAGPFVFRTMLTPSAQAKALAELALGRRGMRRFAVLYPNVPYGKELSDAFWQEVEARGGEMRAAETYEPDRTTFSQLVKNMVGKLYLDERTDYLEKQQDILETEKDPFRRRKALEKLRTNLDPVVDFDAIFIPDFAKNVALVAPALAVEDVVTSVCQPKEVERIRKATGREDLKAVQLLGGNGWDDPTLFEKAGRYVECAIFVDGFFAGSERPETKRFVEAFQKKYQHPPSILEASAYDAARIVQRAPERAEGREALRGALAGLRGYQGATGEMGFDARREPVKPLFFLTVDKNGIRELTPQELATPGAGGP